VVTGDVVGVGGEGGVFGRVSFERDAGIEITVFPSFEPGPPIDLIPAVVDLTA